MLNKYVMFFGRNHYVARRGITSRYYILRFPESFCKVPHQRLLLKLNAHGIGDGIVDWRHWLTDRRQRVVVDGEVSNWKSVLRYHKDKYYDLYYS